MTCPPKGSRCSCSSEGIASKRTDRSVHKPAAQSGGSGGGAGGSSVSIASAPAVAAAVGGRSMAMHATSCSMVAEATTSQPVREAEGERRWRRFPAVARRTWVPSVAAIERVALERAPSAGGGRHSARRARLEASMSRSEAEDACTSPTPGSPPQKTVGWSASKPSSSTSPNSSPSIARTRVSEMNDSTRYVAPSAPPSDHMPLIPGRSTRACSLMPMPLRTTLIEPSLRAPEHVTTCPCPCRSRSTTTKSTIGPMFVQRVCSVR
mmetsp:Transcript_88092/g.265123  ORF Transcript_88092/g.265123 Transcript_88092/m.265123 type:complete len:265 (-) Transcript_88092:61-855(-)